MLFPLHQKAGMIHEQVTPRVQLSF